MAYFCFMFFKIEKKKAIPVDGVITVSRIFLEWFMGKC